MLKVVFWLIVAWLVMVIINALAGKNTLDSEYSLPVALPILAMLIGVPVVAHKVVLPKIKEWLRDRSDRNIQITRIGRNVEWPLVTRLPRELSLLSLERTLHPELRLV